MPSKHLVAFSSGKREEYTKTEFFKKFNLQNDCLSGCHLGWNDLVKIADDYNGLRVQVIEREAELVNLFQKAIRENHVNVIHSIRSRTKEPSHLVEKIIRKIDPSEKNKSFSKYKKIADDNYFKFITDLVGIRLLLRYRNDWQVLHSFILSEFENKKANYIKDYIEDYKPDKDRYIAEKPIAYICEGDKNIYPKNIIEHDFGDKYRSIHYIIKFGKFYAEIQVRTVFQEGWSEIDHDNRYPYLQDVRSLNVFSRVFSSITAVADEMSETFVELRTQTQQPRRLVTSKKNIIMDVADKSNSAKEKLIRSNL